MGWIDSLGGIIRKKVLRQESEVQVPLEIIAQEPSAGAVEDTEPVGYIDPIHDASLNEPSEPAEIVQPSTVPVEIESVKMPRPTAIHYDLVGRLGASRYSGFKEVGVSPLFCTNESASNELFDNVNQVYKPDGFIYGVGCGNIITMLEAFSETPKGLIAVDIDPKTIFFAKMLVAGLSRYDTAKDFANGFLYAGRSAIQSLEEEVLRMERDPALKALFEEHHDRLQYDLAHTNICEIKYDDDFLGLTPSMSESFAERAHADPYLSLVIVPTVLARNYDKLHQLAIEGNIAVLHADMFDPEVLEYVAELPGFKDSNNVVYVSNVADHIFRATYFTPEMYGKQDIFLEMLNGQMSHLNLLGPNSPHQNVFVHTTQKGLGYELQSLPTVPQYTSVDLGI